MRVFKFILCFAVTIGLIYLLDNRWVISGTPVPPLGRFLDPFNGFWRNIEADEVKGPDELSTAAIQDNVTIAYDSVLIPHIFAGNDMDLYFAQGYVTAKHRLWQMEFQTHAAAGRVSEIIGFGKDSAYLNYDRGQRRLAMVFAAQSTLEALKHDQQALLMVEKYTEGVNAYIQSLTYKALPFEYKLLDYRPEPWSTLKCALMYKSMEQSLNMRDRDMEMTNALKLFGRDVVELLYPDREDVQDPIVNNPGGWNFPPLTIPDSIPMAVPDELINIKTLPKADKNTGSNNWAVSGSKTASGAPILCNDPHLNLSLPSLWYVIQLKAPGINTMGASLPGLPCVIIGSTDSVAWALTNATRDLVDWYKISFQDNTHSKYLLDSQWVDTKKVVEKFKVRDGAVFSDTVLYTHWGPIVYDDSFRATNNKKLYAFRWIAHDPSDEFIGFYKLNRAINEQEFLEALNDVDGPAQNFAYATTHGDIGMRIQGKFPLRRPNEGKYVLDGSKRSSGWRSFIPNEQNISYRNPERGFVSSANQYPVDDTYPYYITAASYETYRNRRINKVLSESKNIRPADMMKLQTDNYNLMAEEALPLLLRQLDPKSLTAEEKEAQAILSRWDYVNDVDSEGASYFASWFNHFMQVTWDETDKDDVNLEEPSEFITIKLLKERPDLSFFDIQQTPEKETAREVARKSFSLSIQAMEDWKKEHESIKPEWGVYKDSYINHLMRLDAFRIHVKTGGGSGIVNAHGRAHGPSWRMIVSLEKSGVKMWGAYPGGQSGNPGNHFYASMLDPWVRGEYFSLPFMHSINDSRVFLKTSLVKQK